MKLLGFFYPTLIVNKRFFIVVTGYLPFNFSTQEFAYWFENQTRSSFPSEIFPPNNNASLFAVSCMFLLQFLCIFFLFYPFTVCSMVVPSSFFRFLTNFFSLPFFHISPVGLAVWSLFFILHLLYTYLNCTSRFHVSTVPITSILDVVGTTSTGTYLYICEMSQ